MQSSSTRNSYNDLPVQGSTTIEILTNDHTAIKQLLVELTAADPTARKQAFMRLKSALTVHNATEESLVYPAIRVVGDDKSAATRLYHETAEADVLVFQMDALLQAGNDAEFARQAESLQSAVLAHIDEEEKHAFPHLEKKSDQRDIATLTASVVAFRGALHLTAT